MLRTSLVSVLAAGLILPSIASAQIIDDLLNINDILATLCGPRMSVLWVDETEQAAPCVMAYSDRCVEAPAIELQSCSNQSPEPVQVTAN